MFSRLYNLGFINLFNVGEKTANDLRLDDISR